MRFALFLGCSIPARLKQYEMAVRVVAPIIGLDLVDIREFNCCGYPLRNIDYRLSLLAAAGNLALAEKKGLDIIILCKCGFGMLKNAQHILGENPGLKREINALLAEEGLAVQKGVEVKHLLSVLYHDVGVKAIREKISRPFEGLKIATHYGCHALRPAEIVQFDDPVSPTLFDCLIEITGAQSVSWESKLDCCGAPLFGTNDELAMDLTEKKLSNAKASGADYLCDSCPYCHIQFDTVQKMINRRRNKNHRLPPILYPQLLGLSLGIDGKDLGLEMNRMDVKSITDYLSPLVT